MSDNLRKGLGEQVEEKVTPDSQKSTGQQAKESVTGAADKVSGAVQPGMFIVVHHLKTFTNHPPTRGSKVLHPKGRRCNSIQRR